jgi:hypothetical protein
MKEKIYFPRHFSALLLDGSAGLIARALWWINKEFPPVDINPRWFIMLISPGG